MPDPTASSGGPVPPKKRRLQGACDTCKKKKNFQSDAGDSSEMQGNKCTNCITFNTNCTHFYLSKDSNSSSLNYKNSREHVAAILSQTTVYVPSNQPTVLYQILVDIAKYARNLEELLAVSSSTSLDLLPAPFGNSQDDESADSQQAARFSADADAGDDDGVFVEAGVMEPMSRLALHPPGSGVDENYRFFGKSSNMNFIKTAMQGVDNLGDSHTFGAQRPEFWVVRPWHPAPEPPRPLVFPDDDLLQSLIDIYFREINPILFLLHSPTFRASVVDGEHSCDPHFGALVLAVCAVASRLSDDPRVLMAPDAPLHSAGWKFFSQAKPLQLVALPHTTNSQFRTLYNLQLISLSVLFVSTSDIRASWILSGLGIRIAQEMGAHRRSRYVAGSRTYRELLKRVFWVLFAMDTLLNSVLGRPTVTTTEDYDVDLPSECDDDWWNEPYCFQQPTDKPALAAYMTSYLKLMVIFNRAHRSLYGVKRQKECEPTIVVELDSALNKWVDSIPSHLRWNSNLEGIWLNQSASLYMMYYHVQILIHRPFIAAPGETPADGTFPSLAIVANAARSCGHVMEVQSRRTGDILHHPHALTALSDSALILLLNVWGNRQQRSSSDIIRAVADIKKCVDVLHLYESRYPAAGRKCDMITEMLNRASGSTPLANLPQASLKRRIPDDPGDDDVHAHLPTATTAVQQLEDLELSIQQTDHLFSLPLSTQELGNRPIYDSFDFDFQFSYDPLQTPSSQSSNNSSSGLAFLPLDGAYVNGFEEPGYVPPTIPAAAYSWEDWSSHAGYEQPYQ